MLGWALMFLICGLIAALFGFTDIAGAPNQAGRILFDVFLILSAATWLIGAWQRTNRSL